MMGGIGYFEGDWILDDGMEGVDEDSLQEGDDDDYFSSSEEEIPKITPNPHSVGPSKLFTGVPSRTFFPRGFLWDTGFDLFLIQHFDQDIAKDIISSWMATMDENGWIPREQIFGEEARSKVPQEFQIQYPHYANPPIMVGILRQFLKQDTGAILCYIRSNNSGFPS